MTTVELPREAVHTSERPGSALREGALAMAPLAAGYAPFALAIGVAVGASRDPLAAWAGSVLIFGGSAQLLVMDLVGSGAGLWAAVTAALVINARLLVFSTTMVPLWKDASLARRLLAAAVVIDPLWALVSRRTGQGGTVRDHRRYYVGAASVIVLAWPTTIAIGAAIGGSALGAGSGAASLLQMCVPACLAAVVGPHLRTSAGARAVLAAVVVAWVGRDWPGGTGPLSAMVAAALAGSALGRRGGE